MNVNLGGDRLGSGNKNNISMHGYSRSTHDLSYLWKSTMAAGTLVPFMVNVGLPGDTFDIDLESIVKTHPTVGPLFASFKLQLDVFSIPMRLYHKALHNNKLNIGMRISENKFPQMTLTGPAIDFESNVPPEFQQINQSSLFAYLGIRGIAGSKFEFPGDPVTMNFNAVPMLAYWDIVKNYYVNKQEEVAYYISGEVPAIEQADIIHNNVSSEIIPPTPANIASSYDDLHVWGNSLTFDNVEFDVSDYGWTSLRDLAYDENSLIVIVEGQDLKMANFKDKYAGKNITGFRINPDLLYLDSRPKLLEYLPTDIDSVREDILSAPIGSAYSLNNVSVNGWYPYTDLLSNLDQDSDVMKAVLPQFGLAVKTYQSDLFNNWIKTEFIEGAGSISEITRISTAGDSFSIDTLLLSKKVYDYLNRVAVSGATYQDWIEATFDHNSKWRAETPVYHGGLSKEIMFTEVVSQAATPDKPLGTLGGKGIMGSKHKGGKVIINVDEPSYIMGIVSITPRVDYSQGNAWHVHIETLDNLHKPALDGIGFQDLTTNQMAFWTTQQADDALKPILKSAGKVPAWINYMTDYNKSYGNFADARTQMYMTLNRRYDHSSIYGPFDCTTYIDPAKFNYAFAQTDLSAQNFWVQIACNVEARRKMSAKIIPNL